MEMEFMTCFNYGILRGTVSSVAGGPTVARPGFFRVIIND